MSNFKIVEGYQENLDPGHHNDVGYTDGGQLEVYLFAKEIMNKFGYKTVIDVGCGSAYKLMTHFFNFTTIGYEVDPCLSMLCEKYPERIWIDSGKPEREFNHSDIRDGDLLICSDVIEHILNPVDLLDYLNKFEVKHLIISTPCRDILCHDIKFSSIYGGRFYGPPFNGAHVREWTMGEFKDFISEYFDIVESHYGKNQIECQYHLLRKKSI